MEEGVVDQVVLLRDPLQVLEDLVAEGESPLRDVLHVLEHRHVDVGLDVAHHARVAVPVPGPADSTCLVDQPDLGHPDPPELRARHQTGNARTDDGHVDLVGERLPFGEGGEGIFAVPAELVVAGQISNGPSAFDQALVALLSVLGVDLVRVVVLRRALGVHTGNAI